MDIFSKIYQFLNKYKFVCLLIFIGYLVFANSLQGDFVGDDGPQIINNTTVHSLKNILSPFTGSLFYNGGRIHTAGHYYYRPIMSFVFTILYSLAGPKPFFFHFFQISLHVVNAILVFYIFTYFFRKKALSFFLALIFLVHPINEEAVVYISDLQDVLFVFFGLLTLLFVLQKRRLAPFLSFVLILLSLLSKETGVVFLPILFSLLLIFKDKKIKSYFFFGFTAIAAYCLLRFGLVQSYFPRSTQFPLATSPLIVRLLSVPRIIWYYLSNFIFPHNLAINQQWMVKNASLEQFYRPLFFDVLFFIVLGVVALKGYFQKNNLFKIYLFFLIWFILSFVTSWQIVPLDVTVSTRMFYLSTIALLGIIGTILAGMKIKDPLWNKIILVLAAFILLYLAAATVIRNTDWKNGLTLFSHEVKYSNDSFFLQNNLGIHLLRTDDIWGAKFHIEKALELSPHWWIAHNNLGLIYERLGNWEEAQRHYRLSMRYGNYYRAYRNMGRLLLQLNKTSQAVNFLEYSVARFPNDNYLLNLLKEARAKL